MKTFFLSLIPLALLCLGIFVLAKSVRFQPWTKTGQEEEYKEYRRILALPPIDSNAEERPAVECLETEFNFGVMPPFADGEYTFTITNSGSAPLVLKNGGTSCGCTDIELTATIVPPGEKYDLRVSWNSDKAGQFAQYAKVLTNSPETPELQLWVEGVVSTILTPSVSGLGFSDLVARETRAQEFYLYSGFWDHFEIDRIETSSADVLCEPIAAPSAKVEMPRFASQPDEPVLIKSRIDLKMTVTAQATGGTRRESLKIYVRPPAPSEADAGKAAKGAHGALAAMSSALQPDGTLLIELPVETTVLRRFSLYSPVISDTEQRIIDLGKLRTKSPARDWILIAKVRGDIEPTDVKVSLSGLEGVSASLAKIETTAAALGTSYRITIRAREKLSAAAYNGEAAGKLLIETPGLPDEESLEFRVEMDVLEDN